MKTLYYCLVLLMSLLTMGSCSDSIADNKEDIKVTSVAMQRTLILYVNDTTTLATTISPSTALDKTLFWTSSSTGVATVDANTGLITAKANGKAIIKAIAMDGSKVEASCTITVVGYQGSQIQLSQTAASLQRGQTLTLTYMVLPDDASKSVTWTSSDTSVATVDKDGKVTAIATGKATITVKASDDSKVMAHCEVTVIASSSTDNQDNEGDDGSDDFIHHDNDKDERLDDVIPENIREIMDDYIPIYNGTNPPNVEGTFYINPTICVFCEDEGNGGYSPGTEVIPAYIKLFNQNMENNTLDFIRWDDAGFESGNGVFISGTGNNFSIYFNSTGQSDGITIKVALVISGTKTVSGIKNLYSAYVLIKKGPDPDHILMDEGVFRVFKDGDGYSELRNNVSYPKARPRQTTLEDTISPFRRGMFSKN